MEVPPTEQRWLSSGATRPLRPATTESGGRYVGRAKEGQNNFYYVTGETIAGLNG